MAVEIFRFRLKPSSAFTLYLIFIFLTLLPLIAIFRPRPPQNEVHRLQNDHETVKARPQKAENPMWFEVVAQKLKRRNIKVGLVNMDGGLGQNYELHGLAEIVNVSFDRVDEDRRWEDFFPQWTREEEKWAPPTCPEIPMPVFKDYKWLDVVVARAPCGARDVFRLQVNLMVANLLVRGGWENAEVDRTVYAVFVGSCGPMWEIFRCDDLLWHDGDYKFYQPNLRKLKQKVLMPVGSCQVAPPFAEQGKEVWVAHARSALKNSSYRKPRVAYVTILLDSSEAYVCSAITLAQSIIQTTSAKDLILIVDEDSISKKSQQGLRAAGWKIKPIEHNEWNYSKLIRVWELTDYEKVIFVNSNLIVVKKIDRFFVFPQLSAARNEDKYLFDSGVMVIEPSKCTFETLMEKIRHKEAGNSYNGDERDHQGFVNEMFTWWHRLPSEINRSKMFQAPFNKKLDRPPENLYTMRYNYSDMLGHDLHGQSFAGDEAQLAWWKVYKAMPKRLQSYCAFTNNEGMNVKKKRVVDR